MTPKIKNILDANFKDDTPINTVERIKGILRAYGIETVEKWYESGVPCCYSLRVTVYGTVFGVNGKGVTKEFALASAYGELMERMQLGRIFKQDQQKDGELYMNGSQDGFFTVEELLNKNKKWYTIWSESIKQLMGTQLSEEKILKQYVNGEGKIPTTIFYRVNTQSEEHVPLDLVNLLYGTNGCAAGNTPEEALVQAISEIVERRFSKQILSGKIAVPDISEEVLRSCKVAYEIITYLRSQQYRVVVKDCSLGTDFPVICVCLIDMKTGKYNTQFGACPNFEIALQRTLTESFQGRNIEQVADFENFVWQKDSNFNLANSIKQMVKGRSEISPDFFINTVPPCNKIPGFSGDNNRELLKKCITFLTDQGYDVLIRDHSCLGFPTYQVIVPGYSETYIHRIDPSYNDRRYVKYVSTVLRDPSKATLEHIMGFYMNLTQIEKVKIADGSFSKQANLPVRLSDMEESYLINATAAHLSYTLGREKEVVKHIEKMLSLGVTTDKERLICVKRYLTLSKEYANPDKVRSVLEYFHNPETVQWLYSAVAEKKNLLDSFVLHCDLQCKSSCILSEVCVKKQTDVLSKLIKDKSMEIDRSALKEQIHKLLQ